VLWLRSTFVGRFGDIEVIAVDIQNLQHQFGISTLVRHSQNSTASANQAPLFPNQYQSTPTHECSSCGGIHELQSCPYIIRKSYGLICDSSELILQTHLPTVIQGAFHA